MNKNVYILAALLLCISISFISCSDSDDDNTDKEWKAYNEGLYSKAKVSGQYEAINSLNGSIESVLSKSSTYIEPATQISPNAPTPLYTDSVQCRYEGWFFDKDGNKIIFDSTERPATGSTVNPNKIERKFAISGSIIEGWKIALQNMAEGEEREIVIPASLGYGKYSSGVIPANTTLWFDIKLTKVIKMKGLSE